MFKWIQTQYRQWQERRFLRRHGVSSRVDYDYIYDPRINWSASCVRDFYHGYAQVARVDGVCLGVFHSHLQLRADIATWCRENCQGQVRIDILRASHVHGEWQLDELGGGDYYFVAFERDDDHTLFALRWS